MRQSSARMLVRGALLAILVSMIFNLSAIPVGFAQQGTQVVVTAPTSDVTVPAQFDVDITVVNVLTGGDALWGWQIKLYYNPAVLFLVNVVLPAGHVFDGKVFQFNYNNDSDVGGTYILVFVGLIGDIPGFSGSGSLCRIRFEAKNAGTSTLLFSRPLGGLGSDTFLISYNDYLTFNIDNPSIVFTVVEGSVNVVGADTRPPSAISSNIDKSVMLIGDVGEPSVVISGAIDVTVPDGTPVIIEYWNFSFAQVFTWEAISTVSTTGSQYSYAWYPADVGLLGIRSRWSGSLDYKPATSEVNNISISRSPTYIGLQPKDRVVGLQTVALPTPVFTINVTIIGVTDLREWRIKLEFNQTILAATEASLPTYNIFGADYTTLEATVNNTIGFVQIGARSSAASFNSSSVPGILCQVKFQGIGAPLHQEAYSYGFSELEFDSGASSLKDTPGETIIFNWEQQPAGEIRVETLRIQPSSVELIAASQVTIGDNLAISGRINPPFAGPRQNVTVTYRTATMAERVLAIVETDSNGRYSLAWSANATGTYTFKARWAGNEFFTGNFTERTVTVVEQQIENQGPGLTTYLIIGGVIAIVVIAVVVLYLVKFRKRPEAPVS